MKQTGKVPSAKPPASDRRREVRGLFTAASLDELLKMGAVVKVVIRNRSQEKRRKTD